ncbi:MULTISPECIES: metal ABC transporter ATP-binding protein [Halomicrobium]|uniref:Cobalamin import ATP-binding protein BtuD n=2 Tax=Halomicrobium mukohataei TaxID=57705 RepID=C7P1D0_HALMD|nr:MULTISPECIES: metal ABC transporter ATP-binding protein [Halomicrobium]ACV47138.1 ABC transporter related [Halomicrobium mukohataei DSM 12286]QCD65620.1 metal ABC transporter ATP-binding protein [Halomicrobium mukohataei]QFR20426.1 ATP-binding cassette domain-containing protein [Halomicrobium sp. ZPS1]
MTAARLDDVSFGYGATSVVESVSLRVERGEFLGILGPNGSGKSTLVELLLGLREPDAGTVRLFGEPAADAAGRVGYVQQDVTATASGVPLTVTELVETGRDCRFGGLDADDRAAVRRAMERVGIEDLATDRLDRLSGGQRQRAFIARTLAAAADLLVLDEPTVGIDATAREAFYGLLHELNADGMTIVLVEHDIGVVTEYATRIACLNRRLHFHGPPEELDDSGGFERAYGDNQRVLRHDHA